MQATYFPPSQQAGYIIYWPWKDGRLSESQASYLGLNLRLWAEFWLQCCCLTTALQGTSFFFGVIPFSLPPLSCRSSCPCLRMIICRRKVLLALGARIASYSLAFCKYSRPGKQACPFAHNVMCCSKKHCLLGLQHTEIPSQCSQWNSLEGNSWDYKTKDFLSDFCSRCLSFILYPRMHRHGVLSKWERLSLKWVLERLWFKMTNNFVV